MFLPIVFLLINNRYFVESYSDSCNNVRQQYSTMAIGNSNDVPYSLQPGGICHVTKGCCSADMERSFSKRVKREYTATSRAYFDHVYQTVKARSEHFQMSIERYILHNARISLQSCSLLHSNITQLPVSTTANVHLDNHKQRVMNVYGNVTHYFNQVYENKDVNIRRLIKTFVKESLSVRKKLKSTTCVNEVADNLEAALNAAWLVKENLKFGRSLFGSIRQWRVDDSCVDALVEMNYCSLCNPNHVYQFTKPCSKYCLNVQKGCLAPVLQISSRVTEWSRLLQSLLSDLQNSKSLQGGVSELNHLIHSTLISDSVDDICEHEAYVYKDPWRVTLEYHLERLSEELELFENVFDTLPYQLCDKIQDSSQPGSENHCWNGTAMSTYNCHIADNGLYPPNPTQRVLGDPMLSQQEARLKEMIAMLYESTGIAPSPTPQIEANLEDMCWDPPPRESVPTGEEGDNMSTRDHDTLPAPLNPASSTSSAVTGLSLSLLLLLLSATVSN